MVIKYGISMLHPLLCNWLEIFIFWKIWYFDIFENMIFSNPAEDKSTDKVPNEIRKTNSVCTTASRFQNQKLAFAGHIGAYPPRLLWPKHVTATGRTISSAVAKSRAMLRVCQFNSTKRRTFIVNVTYATNLSLRAIKCCSVVFGVTLKLLVINISPSFPAINKHRHQRWSDRVVLTTPNR